MEILGITEEQIKMVVSFLGLALVVGYLVSYTIEGLKQAGKIGPGQAGKVNEALSAIVGLLVFALRYLGQEVEIADANTLAMALATAIVFIIVTATGSKYVHLLTKWWRGAQLPKLSAR